MTENSCEWQILNIWSLSFLRIIGGVNSDIHFMSWWIRFAVRLDDWIQRVEEKFGVLGFWGSGNILGRLILSLEISVYLNIEIMEKNSYISDSDILADSMIRWDEDWDMRMGWGRNLVFFILKSLNLIVIPFYFAINETEFTIKPKFCFKFSHETLHNEFINTKTSSILTE